MLNLYGSHFYAGSVIRKSCQINILIKGTIPQSDEIPGIYGIDLYGDKKINQKIDMSVLIEILKSPERRGRIQVFFI